MARKRNKPEPIVLGGHFMRINGEIVEIDPLKTDLPLRCKLALYEMMTGVPHVAVESGREVKAE